MKDTRKIEEMAGVTDRVTVAAGSVVGGAFGYMGLQLMEGLAEELLS